MEWRIRSNLAKVQSPQRQDNRCRFLSRGRSQRDMRLLQSIPGRRAFAPAAAVQNRSIRFCRTLVDEGRESLRRANRARRRRGVLALPEGFEPSSQP